MPDEEPIHGDGVGAGDVDPPPRPLGVQDGDSGGGEPVGEGVAAPEREGAAEVDGLAEAGPRLHSGAGPRYFDQSARSRHVHRRLDGGVDAGGPVDLGKAGATVELVGPHIGLRAEGAGVAVVVHGGVVVRIGRIPAGGASLEVEVHTGVDELGIGGDGPRPGDRAAAVVAAPVPPHVTIRAGHNAVQAVAGVADDDVVAESGGAAALAEAVPCVAVDGVVLDRRRRIDDVDPAAVRVAVDQVVLHRAARRVDIEAPAGPAGRPVLEDLVASDRLCAAPGEDAAAAEVRGCVAVDVVFLDKDPSLPCVNAAAGAGGIAVDGVAAHCGGGGLFQVNAAAAAAGGVAVNGVLLQQRGAVVHTNAAATGSGRGAKAGVFVDQVLPDRRLTCLDVYAAAASRRTAGGGGVAVDAVPFHHRVAAPDVQPTAAVVGRVGEDLIALNLRIAGVEVDAAASTAAGRVAEDAVPLDEGSPGGDEDATSPVEPIRSCGRVAVHLVVLYYGGAIGDVDAAAVVTDHVAVDMVLAEDVVGASEVDATAVGGGAGEMAIQQVEPCHECWLGAVDVHDPPQPLRVQECGALGGVRDDPVGESIATLKGEPLVHIDGLAYAVSHLHASAVASHPDRRPAAGRVHRRLDGGVDSPGIDPGEAGAGVELVGADVGLLPKGTGPALIVKLHCLSDGHPVDTGGTRLGPEVRPRRVHQERVGGDAVAPRSDAHVVAVLVAPHVVVVQRWRAVVGVDAAARRGGVAEDDGPADRRRTAGDVDAAALAVRPVVVEDVVL